MEVYLNLINHDVTPCVMYLYCYTFIIFNFAHLAIQDEASVSRRSNYKGDYILKSEDKYKKFEIMYSLKSTWEVINSPQFSGLPVVKKIKDMWKSKKARKLVQKKPRIKRKNVTTTPSSFNISEEEIQTTTELIETTTRKILPGRQNPFVLIEGTLTNTRRNLTRGLMKQTTFMYIRNFRKSPFHYRDKFRSIDLLRLKRAYVTLQMYMTSRDLETILENRPVIMSGFWMRQAAEFIARRHQDIKKLPGVGSPCYKWPNDLTRPDLVFFIHTPRNDSKILEDTRKRLERIVEIYHRMDPPVIVLDQSYNNPTEKMMSNLRKIMIDKLSAKYPYSYEYLKYKLPTVARKKKKIKANISNNVTTEGGAVKNDSLCDR